MSICRRNFCLWTYDYSTLKSFVIAFNETKFYYCNHRRKWYLGPNEVKEEVNYKHLNSVSSQAAHLFLIAGSARGKSFIVRKSEVHSKIF